MGCFWVWPYSSYSIVITCVLLLLFLPKMAYSIFRLLAPLVTVVVLAVMAEATPPGIANNPSHATCKIKKYKHCYNLVHVCPKFCPDQCYVECASCKPICGSDANPPPEDDPTPSPPSETYYSPPPPAATTPSPPVSTPTPPYSPPLPSPTPVTPSPPTPSSPPPPSTGPPSTPPAISSPPPITSSPPPPNPNPPSPPPTNPNPPSTPPVDHNPPSNPNPPSTPPTNTNSSPPMPPTNSNPPSTPPDSPNPPSTPPRTPSMNPNPPPAPPMDHNPPSNPNPPSTPPTNTNSPPSPPPTPPTNSNPPSNPPTSPNSPTPPTPNSPSPSLPPPTPSETPNSPTINTPPPASPRPPAPTPPSSSTSAAKRVRCKNVNYPKCYNMYHTCPTSCPSGCEVDCVNCKPVCHCDRPGAVCQDPRFIGADGITFYFHGKKEKDFCLVSDPNLHINAHLIGKRNPSLKRDFTWVQSLGILFRTHRLFVTAQKTTVWDDSVDCLTIALDGHPVALPKSEGNRWQHTAENPTIVIVRLAKTNHVMVEAKGLFRITAKVVPITEEDSRIHSYGIDEGDSFAHLDLGFKFFGLSSEVNGVLGQTYADGYVSSVNVKAAMAVMGREEEFETSSLFATDCAVARFGGGGKEEVA